jgi:hypothetical protein
MVSSQEQNRMADYIVGLIEESRRFNIQARSSGIVEVKQKPELVEIPSTVRVVMHTEKMTLPEFENILIDCDIRGIYVAMFSIRVENIF